ncbi:MAG: DUF362 domain-containing protein [Pelosinus sp.]|nr:DUF362 domain-containing protein [Pelosinus sp.]
MGKSEIYVTYGTNARQMVYRLLEELNIKQQITPAMRIGLKPNLVVAKKASEGATTSPELVEGIIEYFKANGFNNLAIMEGSWVGDNTKRAFKVCGYDELSKKYNVPLYDLKDDTYIERQVGDLKLKVCQKPLEVDFLINLPVLKAHCQTAVTCALKNLKGCIPDGEKRRFHSLGLHKPIGYLAKALPVQLIIVDAMCGDLTFEEGGNPVRMDRLIAGFDPVLIDTYGASLLGYSPDDIKYIGIAEKMGVGSTNLAVANIREYNTKEKNGGCFKASGRAKSLARNVVEDKACSACYGSLIHALQRLSENGSLVREKIYIGQGFCGQAKDGIGIGNCTKSFMKHVGGCPPSAKAIVDFLQNK